MKNEINVKPLKTYKAPNVPTLEESRKNPEFLKKLPLRWRKSAAVAAVIGFTGMWLLTGCSEHNRFHHGGEGGAIYFVYLTEQEALNIIRSELESAGLNFNAEPPVYIADDRQGETINFDLYDSEKGVAIAYNSRYNWISEQIFDEFIAQNDDIKVGIFQDRGAWTNLCRQCNPSDEESAKAKEEAMPQLEEYLNEQIQAFIELLRAEGILE
jgi:hypothetical protein